MATENTSHSWYWYVRKKGKNWVLGLIDENGDAPDTASLNIDYWYDQTPDEIASDNDTLPIPAEFEHGFSMGVVFEIMRMMGKNAYQIRSFQQNYEKAVYDAIHAQVDETQQPLQIAPIDLRMDEEHIGTVQRSA